MSFGSTPAPAAGLFASAGPTARSPLSPNNAVSTELKSDPSKTRSASRDTSQGGMALRMASAEPLTNASLGAVIAASFCGTSPRPSNRPFPRRWANSALAGAAACRRCPALLGFMHILP